MKLFIFNTKKDDFALIEDTFTVLNINLSKYLTPEVYYFGRILSVEKDKINKFLGVKDYIEFLKEKNIVLKDDSLSFKNPFIVKLKDYKGEYHDKIKHICKDLTNDLQ